MHRYPPVLRYLIWLLFAGAFIAALIIAKTLLAPVFFSVLFAYLLYPLAQRLEQMQMPRILTNIILIVGTLIVLAGIGYLIGLLVARFTSDLPTLKHNFEHNLSRFRWALGRTFGITAEQLDHLTSQAMSAIQFMGSFFTTTANTILAIGLIPVYTFLLLFYRNKFRDAISMAVRPDQEQTVQDIVKEAAEIVPRYLKGLLIVCFILIWLNALGFYLIGVKFALFMGLIAALFNLIPYLGTIIGYGIVCLFVFATQSPAIALAVIIQFFIVQFIENNILTPNITGSYVQINPLVIIFSLIAGGMIWGLPGMFMVIPYLAMFKIVCEYVPGLKPLGFLLSTRGTEPYSITIKSLKKRFGWYQK